MDFDKLKAPFPFEKISWRVGSTNSDKTSGIALAYIDARDLYERLDAVCGPANWQIRYPHANGKTCAEIGIKVDGEWVWKANGAGDSDFEGEKGAFSDAAKRAGVPWGIGRYLYDMPNEWVYIDEKRRIKKDQLEILKNEYMKLIGEKPFSDESLQDFIDEINDCYDREKLEKAKEKGRGLLIKMSPAQKSKVTKSIKDQETKISNRELDKTSTLKAAE